MQKLYPPRRRKHVLFEFHLFQPTSLKSRPGTPGETPHLGCFVKDDSGILDVTMALVELCKSNPQRVQLANSLYTWKRRFGLDLHPDY